jgi:hypothetical protein
VIGDLLAVLLFVAIGLLQHGIPLTSTNLFTVGWTFAAALLVGHLAAQSWRKPFAVWPQGVFVWAITVVGGMAVRTLFGMGTEPSFVIVTAVFTGLIMLGWRAVASFVTRGERVEVVDAAELSEEAADEGEADDSDAPGKDESEEGKAGDGEEAAYPADDGGAAAPSADEDRPRRS